MVNFLLGYSHLCYHVEGKPLLEGICVLYIYISSVQLLSRVRLFVVYIYIHLNILVILSVYSLPSTGMKVLHAYLT